MRLFPLDEALALLPTVRQLLTEIQARRREIEERSAALDRLLAATGGNGYPAPGGARARGARAQAAGQLQRLMTELDETGAELKGIDEGLVDFRSRRQGRVICLCWRLGEEAVSSWD